tara:strand:+ start:22 stop:183 length:162 start_codon:yes stop_codon:yes gene_type:complete
MFRGLNGKEKKTKRSRINSPRMAPCSAHAYASEKQEEIQQKEKTSQKRFGEIK